MDATTLAAYDANAAAYAAEWLAQRPGGTLYLSWRVTDELAPDDTVLHDELRPSVSSGKLVQRLVVRRRPGDPPRR